MPVWSDEVDAILSVGQAITGERGVSNWALTADQALIALEMLAAKGIAVLGGEVYQVKQTGFVTPVPTNDNFFCSSMPDEPYARFVERSRIACSRYITHYSERHSEALFSLRPNMSGKLFPKVEAGFHRTR